MGLSIFFTYFTVGLELLAIGCQNVHLQFAAKKPLISAALIFTLAVVTRCCYANSVTNYFASCYSLDSGFLNGYIGAQIFMLVDVICWMSTLLVNEI